jgi:chromosome segregation ATPase
LDAEVARLDLQLRAARAALADAEAARAAAERATEEAVTQGEALRAREAEARAAALSAAEARSAQAQARLEGRSDALRAQLDELTEARVAQDKQIALLAHRLAEEQRQREAAERALATEGLLARHAEEEHRAALTRVEAAAASRTQENGALLSDLYGELRARDAQLEQVAAERAAQAEALAQLQAAAAAARAAQEQALARAAQAESDMLEAQQQAQQDLEWFLSVVGARRSEAERA